MPVHRLCASDDFGARRNYPRTRRVSIYVSDRKEIEVANKSGQDKAKGAGDKVKGRAKETFGSLTGDQSKKNEGRADQDKGNLKKKKGQFKDLLN
jgi:uncharacterized protein YjbJ (UPF0337 family)